MSIKKILFDKTVIMILASRLFNSLAGLVSIYFVFKYLSPSLQGYYYTFINLIGFSVFFEFGLATLIIQHVSHHMSDLDFSYKTPSGSSNSITNFYAFVKNILRLSALLSVLILLMLSIVGLYIFRNTTELYFPWISLVLLTALNFFVNTKITVIEGTGKIVEVAKLRFFLMLFTVPTLWVGLSLGFGVYSLSFQLLITIFYLAIWISKNYQEFFLGTYRFNKHLKLFDFVKSVFPLQSRLSISFLSGYMSSQIFVPLMFAMGNVEFSGKFGVTLQAFNAINGFAITWINSKLSLFGASVARGNHALVRNEFRKLFIMSLLVLLLMLLAFWMLILYLIVTKHNYLSRFLDVRYLIMLTATSIAIHFYGGINTYLLSFKRDPLFKLNLIRIIILCCGFVSLLFIPMSDGLFYLYLFNSILIGMLGSVLVFINFNGKLV